MDGRSLWALGLGWPSPGKAECNLDSGKSHARFLRPAERLSVRAKRWAQLGGLGSAWQLESASDAARSSWRPLT